MPALRDAMTAPSPASPASRPAHAIIGLSTSVLRDPPRVYHDPHGEPPRQELALGLTHPQAIRAAGAVPVVIPPLDLDSIEPLLDGLCGLCLSGGPDLHPSIYGAEPHRELGPTEPQLDAFEVALVRSAEARALPVLAICRGLQVLNVSRGGSLWQDLPTQRPSDVAHRQDQAGSVPTHDVTVEPGSLVAACLGETTLRVNSFHHQAVDRLGDGPRIVGRASDGTVEAVEATDRPFTIAVPWHAESMVRSPEQARMLAAFAQAARRARSGIVREKGRELELGRLRRRLELLDVGGDVVDPVGELLDGLRRIARLGAVGERLDRLLERVDAVGERRAVVGAVAAGPHRLQLAAEAVDAILQRRHARAAGPAGGGTRAVVLHQRVDRDAERRDRDHPDDHQPRAHGVDGVLEAREHGRDVDRRRGGGLVGDGLARRGRGPQRFGRSIGRQAHPAGSLPDAGSRKRAVSPILALACRAST